MAKTIRLDIVTPERIAYSDDVNMVIARAIDGDIGILPGHAPLIAPLDIGALRTMKDGDEKKISICTGFMEVKDNKVTILAACAELPEEIDVKRAEAAKSRAEARLKLKDSGVDVARAEAALRRAILRLQLSGTLKKS